MRHRDACHRTGNAKSGNDGKRIRRAAQMFRYPEVPPVAHIRYHIDSSRTDYNRILATTKAREPSSEALVTDPTLVKGEGAGVGRPVVGDSPPEAVPVPLGTTVPGIG